MKRIVLTLMFLLALSSSAFALSDAEYRRLKRTNSDFARADRELTQAWQPLKTKLSSRDFANLQKEQREWIRKGRDDSARAYMNDGYSRAEAYTMATDERTEYLRGKTGTRTTQTQKAQPKPKEPEPEPEPDDKGEIEEERFTGLDASDPQGNYKSKDAFMTIIITDQSSMEAAVTITLNSSQATWSSEGWIDDNVLILYDKNYSDCRVRLTFEENRVIVETSQTESWKDVLGVDARLDGIYTRT